MNARWHRLVMSPLGVLLLLGTSSPEDALKLAPAAGTELSKLWEERVAWTLETMEMTADGSVVEQTLPEVSGTADRRIRVQDTYVKVDEGRVVELTRAFRELGLAARFDVNDRDTSFSKAVRCESPLEDETVRFRWDEDEEAYAVELVGEVSGGWLLDDLEADMDLAAFLPAEEVEEDGSWDVDPAAIASLLRAGGDLKLFPAEADRGSLFTIPTPVVLASAFASLAECVDEFEGEVTATYAGMVDVDGERLARIELAFDVSAESDRTDRFIEYVERVDPEAETDALTLEFEVDVEAEGTLLWHPTLARPAGLELTAEIALVTNVSWSEAGFEEPIHVEGTYEVQGTSEVRLTVE